MMLFLSDCIQGVNVGVPGHIISLSDKGVTPKYTRRQRELDADQLKVNEQWSKENYLVAISHDGEHCSWNKPNTNGPVEPSFHNVFAIRVSRKQAEDAYDGLDLNNTTYARLKTQFVKSLSRKIVSRSLVNRMVEAMAKHT